MYYRECGDNDVASNMDPGYLGKIYIIQWIYYFKGGMVA